jgi:predicted nucleotidyltransferase component of viral defense system
MNIKVDFIRFKYGFNFPIIKENGLRLANITDIAPMKLDAIVGRGKKKDFYDLFFLLKQYSFKELFELYQQKYQHTSIFHVIKSITYFADAENDLDPFVFDKNLTWEKVKNVIKKEIRKL